MKNLNESIGLVGANRGMSNSSGDGDTFDVNTDPEVARLTAELAQKSADLIKYTTQKNEAISGLAKRDSIAGEHLQNVGGNTSDPNYINAMRQLDQHQQDLGRSLKTAETFLATLKVDVPALTKQLADAKVAAIKANNDIIDQQIKKEQVDALTNPDALRNIQELERLKREGEQALAKQKIEADVAKNKSSNIKIYVIVGAVVLGLVAIAGIWIWLKSRKAV